MAAQFEPRGATLVALRRTTPSSLAELLDEEVAAWSRRLHWDFRASADLVRRYVGMEALDGFALVESGRVIGYSYFVIEERKALIGDLYLSERFATREHQRALLEEVLGTLRRDPYVLRVEAQLMMLECGLLRQIEPALPQPAPFERLFLIASREAAAALAPPPRIAGIAFENWRPPWLDEAAALIANVYQRHVDSSINDQYRSAAGARRFLQNIVQFPGCGQFHQPSSWIARDGAGGKLVGICLASMVAQETGHITQVCVAPERQGSGVGYELLRLSMQSLAGAGCKDVTLTVTASNRHAVALYESMGYRELRRFDALVWDRLAG